jgi:hypothetical protein
MFMFGAIRESAAPDLLRNRAVLDEAISEKVRQTSIPTSVEWPTVVHFQGLA